MNSVPKMTKIIGGINKELGCRVFFGLAADHIMTPNSDQEVDRNQHHLPKEEE